MMPVALGMIATSKLSVVLTERLGTKIVVAHRARRSPRAVPASTCGVDTGYGHVAVALGMLGSGMALAMSPATESIMGSLPKAKAGIGSAMNDVVREVGGTLGVAVLGSVLASGYGGSMDDAVEGLPPGAAEAASDSVGAAHQVAAQLGGDTAARLIQAADQAFVDAMSTTATLAAAVALFGALIAAAFLPSRARTRRRRRGCPAGAGCGLIRERR